MAKKRIHQLAKELEVASADILHKAQELGIEVKTASSGLTPEEEELVKLSFEEENNNDIDRNVEEQNVFSQENIEETINDTKVEKEINIVEIKEVHFDNIPLSSEKLSCEFQLNNEKYIFKAYVPFWGKILDKKSWTGFLS